MPLALCLIHYHKLLFLFKPLLRFDPIPTPVLVTLTQLVQNTYLKYGFVSLSHPSTSLI